MQVFLNSVRRRLYKDGIISDSSQINIQIFASASHSRTWQRIITFSGLFSIKAVMAVWISLRTAPLELLGIQIIWWSTLQDWWAGVTVKRNKNSQHASKCVFYFLYYQCFIGTAVDFFKHVILWPTNVLHIYIYTDVQSRLLFCICCLAVIPQKHIKDVCKHI